MIAKNVRSLWYVLVPFSLSLSALEAAEVADLPATATEVINATGALPTYHLRDDGFGATSDLLDMTFTLSIDFVEKATGTREVIWETGGGTVGTSVVYEAPSTIVMRSAGNGGLSLVTASYQLAGAELDGGAISIAWTYDVANANGTQTASLIVNGQIVASEEANVGGDWSGSDGAKIGTAGGVAANGANATITAVAFTSGTIDLVTGMAFYADTLWLPLALDSDNDGIADTWEEIYFPGDLTVLTAGGDNDADGLNDEDEFAANTNPTDADTDDDDLTDGREANSAVAGFTATDPLLADTDSDGRLDGDEVDGVPASDPQERDTDGDRFIDGIEVAAGSNPASSASTPPIGALLCAYWPLDSVDAGGLSVPDLAGGGLDLDGVNLDTDSVVAGRVGNAISFDNAAQTLLCRDSAPGEDLPISQHQDYTVALWVNVVGTGQSDLRFFSEASRSSNTPLFNLGTNNTGADNSLDVYLRNLSINNNHPKSVGMPLDGTWHHIAFVRYGESFEVYIDGALDPQSFAFVDPFVDELTSTTSIGGIHRALGSNWVTGLIDEVSTWKVALPVADIAELASGTAADALVEDSDSDGMPDHWEVANSLNPASAGDAAISSDTDSLTNLQEYLIGTNPNLADSDADGLDDDVESNTGIWVSAADTGTNPRRGDSDLDGLSDGVENPDLPFDQGAPLTQPGSDPNIADTDEDLVDDGAEAAAGSDPTSAGSKPEPDPYFSWCADEEPLGTGFGADGVVATVGDNPPVGALEAQGAVSVVAISVAGAGQTEFAQTFDFDGASFFNITPEPNDIRSMLGVAAIEVDGTIELYISPDSLSGGNQYVWESGGTGDGNGLVLVDNVLHFGVNTGNNAPIGSAVASVDLTPLYGSAFAADDYLLVRINCEPLSRVVLGVTNLRTGLTGLESQSWTGGSWDGGDPLALGNFQGGRGGDRNNQLSTLPGATVNWSSFDGQIAKFNVYPGVLAPTINVNTERFEITDITLSANNMITLEWVSFPGEKYRIVSSTDLKDFGFEIADSLDSAGPRTSFTFPNFQSSEPRIYYRVEVQID